MAKKQQRSGKTKESDFVQIDAYMIPAPQAEMYRVLREAVAEDLHEVLSKHYAEVKREVVNEEEGEAVIALDEKGMIKVQIFLNPTNISQAQKARDKDQIEKFIEHFEK